MTVRKNPKKDRYVALAPTPEDEAFARTQDRYNCLIVRCIQRQIPDATRVMVDNKHIAFSLERDDTRYTFITPPEVVENIIKPFDRGEPITPNFTFTLQNPISAEPVHHRTQEERQKARQVKRNTRKPPTTKNVAVRHLNRFMDVEVQVKGDSE